MNEAQLHGEPHEHNPLPSPQSGSNLHKIDTVYYNATMKVLATYNRYIIFHACKIIALVIFTAVHFSEWQYPNRSLLTPFILAIVAAFIYVCEYLYVRSRIKRVQENIEIADNFGHATLGDIFVANSGTLEDCRSDTYDFANPSTAELPEDQKKKYEESLAKSIESVHLVALRWTRSIIGLLHLLSLALTLYIIVTLANSKDLDTACKVMGSLFVAFELLAKIELVLGILFCLIMPFVFMVACCCVCCGKGRAYQTMPEIPAVKYSPALALESDPECRICFQSFVPDEEIMLLPCDKKHVFHKFCISGWFKVSPTCPMCRKNFTRAQDIAV